MSHNRPQGFLPEPRNEFELLLRKQLDQELTASDEQRLDELLEDHPEFREQYVAQIWTDTLLQWSLAGSPALAADEANFSCPLKSVPLAVSSSGGGPERRRGSLLRSRIPHALALGMLLLVGGLTYWNPFEQTAVEPPNLVGQPADEPESKISEESAFAPEIPAQGMAAILLDSEDAIWDGEERHIDYGRSFPHGRRLTLKSGLARLAFACGAGVTLEGPAVLELCSGWQACLHRGKLAAIVPEGAEGFTVLTPQKRIIDLGTKFGAEVDDSGQASVQVYEGEVKVESREEKPEYSFLMTPVSLPRYSESRSDMPEIHLRGVDSSESVSVPTLEQLMAAKSGTYPPRRSHRLERTSGLPFAVPDEFPGQSTIPPGVLYGADFSPLPSDADSAVRLPANMRLNSEFSHVVHLAEPLRQGSISGGHYALELSGRDPAYPSIANRMDLKLPEPIREEVYFSFLARYDGLDETDFFALWFDNNRGEGLSHSTCPNAGIRFGDYFARMQVHHEGLVGVPENNAVFFLVGRLLKNEQGEFQAMEMWLNPPLEGDEIPPPDVFADKMKPSVRSFSVVGLRMGKDTEPDDRLYFDRLVIGNTFRDVTEPFDSVQPSVDTSAVPSVESFPDFVTP